MMNTIGQINVYAQGVMAISSGLLLAACVAMPDPVLLDTKAMLAPNQHYHVISERHLNADGVNKGLDSYQLIRRFAGEGAIESPDLYQHNHPGIRHIYEANDDVVGDHFVFTIHKNHDKDRGVQSITDRQRNEIKAYKGSSEALKAYKNQLFAYRWKFKMHEDLTVSNNFTHFFQLKAVDGGAGSPILTLSGREKQGQWLEITHRMHGNTTQLKTVPLAPFKGRWLQIDCFVDYSNEGQLTLRITDMLNAQLLLALSIDKIDMLRGESSGDFVRPKWGIYRSLRSKHLLREQEEKVFFADFTVQRLQRNKRIER